MACDKINPHCKKCRYRIWQMGELCCNYSAVEQHCRLVHIEDCRYWLPEGMTEEPEEAPEKRTANEHAAGSEKRRRLWPQIMALYEQGLTNAEICEELDLLPGTLSLWLQNAGLPSRRRRAKRKYEDLEGQMRALYDQGATDKDIMRALGVRSQETIRNWRRREGLENNYTLHRAKQAQMLDRKIRMLYDAGLCDDDICKELHISVRTVEAWRQDRGLPSHLRRVYRDKRRRICEMLDKGCSNAEIMQTLDVSLYLLRSVLREEKGLEC